MLKEILKIIHESGYFSNKALAAQLNASEEVIADAINQLVRMGYIKKDERVAIPKSACGGCPHARSCNKEIVVTYQITEKGRELV